MRSLLPPGNLGRPPLVSGWPFVVGLILVFSGCSEKAPAPPGRPPEVLVTGVIQRDVPIYREWIGSLDGFVNAEIRAQVSGYLIAQRYKEGSLVRKGDLLFEIDPRPLQAALDQVKANLAKAEAAQLKADLDNERSRILFVRNVISAQERDQAVQAAEAARADTKAQEAALETAELNLQFTRILAPVEGVAGIAAAQIGDLVGPSADALTTISRVDPIKAYVTVSEQAYIEFTRRYLTMASRARREEELRMELILADGSVFPYPGRFYAADRQVDQTTGALRFAGLFPNPNRDLRPGQFCRVRARTENREGALLVPQRAVMELQGKFQVALVGRDGKAAIRNVKPGERFGSLWVIEEGLAPGDTVVVEGVQKVRDGEPVAARPWEPPPDFLQEPTRPKPEQRASPMPTVPPELLHEAPTPTPVRTPIPMPSASKRGKARARASASPAEPAPLKLSSEPKNSPGKHRSGRGKRSKPDEPDSGGGR